MSTGVVRVVSAAIKVGGEVWHLPPPARHCHLIHAWAESHQRHIPKHEQGFMLSNGDFVERGLAAYVACEPVRQEEAHSLLRRPVVDPSISKLLVFCTIYENPPGFLNKFVTRRWVVREGVPAEDPHFNVASNLEEARTSIPEDYRNIGRLPNRERGVVETWVRRDCPAWSCCPNIALD